MRVLTIDWPETDAEGWIDYIPIDDLDRNRQSRVLRHLIIGPAEEIIYVECWLSVHAQAFELEYNGDRTVYNSDIESGTLRIEFNHHDRDDDVKVLWRDSDADEFILGPRPEILEDPFIEGVARRVERTIFQRDPIIRLMKIAAAGSSRDSLNCEVCKFDFEYRYGNLGKGYCEVHHVNPIAIGGPVKTKLSDLAILCSNCHSMIHRYGRNLSLDELKEVIEEARAKRAPK